MTNEDKTKTKEKLQHSLIFEHSDLWDGILFIIEEAKNAEIGSAVSQVIEESKRAHQCGRVEALFDLKDLLIQTREEALKNAGRK